MTRNQAKRAIITVGDGRGFVVELLQNPARHRPMRAVITAAHCLPRFPPCATFSYLEERTYERLLGPLGSKPTVWGECLFADPIADIAVTGTPDTQAVGEEADRFEALVEDVVPLSLSDCPAGKEAAAWMLSLEGKWFRCTTQHVGGPLWTMRGAKAIQLGMSGSPILAADASVIGVVTASSETAGRPYCEGGPNPRPVCDLPRRFLLPAATPLASRASIDDERPQ
jgi:hypothetical protein